MTLSATLLPFIVTTDSRPMLHTLPRVTPHHTHVWKTDRHRERSPSTLQKLPFQPTTHRYYGTVLGFHHCPTAHCPLPTDKGYKMIYAAGTRVQQKIFLEQEIINNNTQWKGKKRKKEVKSSRYQSMTVVMSHTALHRIALNCNPAIYFIDHIYFLSQAIHTLS